MITQDFTLVRGKWRSFWEQHPDEYAQLAVLEEKIAHTFQNRELLFEAMVHRSAISPFEGRGGLPWNERLEFLGDSVLSLTISTLLWERRSLDEGQLSQVRASLISEASLAQLAQHLGLNKCLSMGKIEKRTGGQERPSLLADALEALIGAIYLDSSFDVASKKVSTWFLDFFSIDEDVQDPKTRLQELLQGQFQQIPEYQTLEESGPDHAKMFRVAVNFHGRTLAEACGSSKKRASQAAAKLVLEKWQELTPFKEKA